MVSHVWRRRSSIPTLVSMTRFNVAVFTASSCLALACSDATDPARSAPPVAFAVISGDSQLHFPGATTFSELGAALVAADGERVLQSGVPVMWSVLSGGGSIESSVDTTTFRGAAFARWTLGDEEGANRAMVSAEGIAPVEFFARAAKAGPIVFVSERHGRLPGNETAGDLYVMKENGSDVMPLFGQNRPSQALSDPDWSPDGSKILFVRATERPFGGTPGLLPRGLFWITPDATREEQVPVSGVPGYVQFLEEPAWAPFGSKIVARLGGVGEPSIPPQVTPGHIHVMNSGGNNILTLATPATSGHDPDWSPVGDLIAFSCEVDGFIDVCVMDMKGDNFSQLTADDAIDTDPAWSPDGTRILFARNPDEGGGIWVVNADGTGLEQVISGKATAPSWSPDGSRFVVTIDDGNDLDIYVVELATLEITNLTNSPYRDREPSWRW